MPDAGQKTLPLLHKLKGLAGIVEPERERADSELSMAMYNIHTVEYCTSYV